ncbi:MAG: UvrD-helicase domain-containing protein, partial [Chthoniobacteraceae bacterium]|nr:UvrD-helicase domain-containing protein [Chthoniobacteraceae bacterium]
MNPPAFDAASTPLERGTTLIEASAGTGKTYSLAALFLRLVLEEGVPVGSILAVTYTTAATQELRERVRALLRGAWKELKTGLAENPVVARYLAEHKDKKNGERALELAAQSFDEAQIFTIHGFCQRMLQEHAFESGVRYGAELLTDSRPLLEEAAADFWRTRFSGAPALLAALALDAGVSPEGWANLLGETRNHPDLALLPESAGVSCEALAARLEAAFAELAEAWRCGGAALSALLQADKALKPSERKKRLALLPVLDRLPAREPDQELVAALPLFCASAIAEAAGARKTPPSDPFFARCEAFCALAEEYFQQLTHEFLAYAETALAARKRERNVLTYDDLLTRLHAALHGPDSSKSAALARAIGAKYQAALIDEFQDTDPLQYALFRRIFGGGGHWLFWIGDPKQAIYGFRGADVFTYLKAAASATRRYTLNTNWRSAQALLEGFNAFFQQSADPFLEEQIRYYPVFSPDREVPADARPALRIRHLLAEGEREWNLEDAARRMADAVAADAASLHAEDGWQWSDLAVLVRTHRQAALIQNALRRRGIRSVLHAEESVFRTPHAAELARVLDAALAPGDSGRLHAALATPLFALNANALAALGDTERQEWAQRFAEWRALWREAGFAALFRRLAAACDLRRRVMEQPGGERRLTNLLHLAELLQEAQEAARLTP